MSGDPRVHIVKVCIIVSWAYIVNLHLCVFVVFVLNNIYLFNYPKGPLFGNIIYFLFYSFTDIVLNMIKILLLQNI